MRGFIVPHGKNHLPYPFSHDDKRLSVICGFKY